MLYKVTSKYGRGHEQELKKFKTIAEAKNFIADELRNAQALKVNVTFILYEGIDILEEYDAAKPNPFISEEDEAASGGGKTSGATFRPTPLNTTPTPRGLPKKWIVDENDKDNKDDESK